jgi:hypothetical protein
MPLSIEDVARFFRLNWGLMFFVNRELKVVDGKVDTPQAYAALPPETRIEVHEALVGRIDLVDAYADENPFRLDEADLEVIRSWKHLVAGKFYAFRQLRSYMVFLSSTEPVVAYGVVALFDPFEALIGPHLPRMVKTTLLPFEGKIIYDGLMSTYNMTFGAGVKRRLDASFKEAKARDGIVTSLPWPAGGPPPAAKKPAGKKSAGKKSAAKKRAAEEPTGVGGESIPSAVRPAYERITRLTDAFCREHLDAEYAALCREMAGVLARKRPSPLTRGKPESWASGIVRAVGWVNFLGDPSQPHHMKMTDIDEGFGVSEATGSAKSMAIRNALRIGRFDPEWTLPSRMDDNPLIWMLEVNGLIMDIRSCPREVQEVAFEKGLIPYMPADRADESAEE